MVQSSRSSTRALVADLLRSCCGKQRRYALAGMGVVLLCALVACADSGREEPTHPSLDRWGPAGQGSGLALERFPEKQVTVSWSALECLDQ